MEAAGAKKQPSVVGQSASAPDATNAATSARAFPVAGSGSEVSVPVQEAVAVAPALAKVWNIQPAEASTEPEAIRPVMVVGLPVRPAIATPIAARTSTVGSVQMLSRHESTASPSFGKATAGSFICDGQRLQAAATLAWQQVALVPS